MTYIYIVVLLYGLMLGNYLSTAYHRLPRNIPINGLSRTRGRKPHCSSCGHELKMYEYFPMTSWVTTRFRCNYCGAKTPKEYFWLEFGMTTIALLAFYLRPILDIQFVLTLPVYSLFFLNVMLYLKHKRLYGKLVNFTILTSVLVYLIV